MPRKGYRQSDEHRAKIAASVSAAMTGRRHSNATKARIGEGVRRAARGRKWWYDPPPTDRNYIVSLVFSKIAQWWAEGEMPELTAVTRNHFERMTPKQQKAFIDKVIVRLDPPPVGTKKRVIHDRDGRTFRVSDDIVIEFVDGTYWPSRRRVRSQAATRLPKAVPRITNP